MRPRRLVLLLVLLASLVAAPAPAWAARAPQQPVIHKVQWGETLSSIAWRYGVTVQALMEINHLTNDAIYAGQRLAIPADAESTRPEPVDSAQLYHVVRWGETLSSIAQRYGVTLEALMQANGLLSPDFVYAGQGLIVPGEGHAAPSSDPPDTYVVQAGDTLSAIADRFGLSPASLARLNGIVNPAFVYVGQRLRLKGGTEPPTPETGPAGDKRIYINLSEQHLYAYEGRALVYSFVISSGMPPYYTQTGDFAVLNKLPNPYSNAWNVWMPNWLGIYWVGNSQNGIHALPILPNGERLWEGYLGQPASYGCIILGVYEAELLYHWADVGTPVIIRY